MKKVIKKYWNGEKVVIDLDDAVAENILFMFPDRFELLEEQPKKSKPQLKNKEENESKGSNIENSNKTKDTESSK